MEKFYTDYKGQLRSGNVEIFLEISIDIYRKITIINNEINELESKLNPPKIEDIVQFSNDRFEYADKIGLLTRKKFKLANQGIIIISTYYEALINEIGIVALGSKYYQENLDKLSVQAKWEIVLKLVYSKTLNKDSKEYESLIKITSLRNKLVHYKTKSLKTPDHQEFKKAKKNALNRINIFESAIRSLIQFHDNLIEIDSNKDLLKFFNFKKELGRI